jgi:glycosyltransferase involved in cell wall biosynthesis
LYPVVDERFFVNASTPVAKEPMMLSVGRFVSTGHTKNQLEIAEAFRSAVSLGLVSTTWKLVLIGSANDRRYLERVEEALLGMNYEIIIDADFDVVVDRFRRAAIYVHASGLGVSEDDAPELFEHFGMAVAQGAGSGCVPIVFGAAGPAEIIRDIGIGYTSSSVFELVELLGDVTGKYDRGDFDRGLYQSLPSAVRVYSEEAFRRQLTSVIGDASEVAIPQEYPAPHPRDNESIVRNGGAPSVPKVNASPARRSRRK